MADGWANMGAAFGGDSEKSYQEGLALGAKTEDALAAARERVEKNAARARLESDLVANNVPRNQARAASTALTAGAGLTDPIQMMLKQQEYDFRAKAGDPNTPLDIGQRSLLGVANGPVEPIYKVGNRAFNKFETPENIDDLGAVFGGDGSQSAQMQLLDRFGFPSRLEAEEGPFGRVAAADLIRDTFGVTEAGGAPTFFSKNPRARYIPSAGAPPQGPSAAGPSPAASAPATFVPPTAPLVPVQQVASNAAAIASAKQQGEAQAKAASGLPDTLADIDKMRMNINGLLTDPGFDTIYGNLQGTGVGQIVTGLASQDAENARAKLAQLDAQAFGVSIQKMVGLGQLSNAEGLKVTQAFTRATNPRIGQEEARMAWQEVLDGLSTAEERAKTKATATPTLPGVAAPAAPQASTPGNSGGEVKVLGGKKYVKVNGQWYEDDGT